jgi:hypothetical protein
MEFSPKNYPQSRNRLEQGSLTLGQSQVNWEGLLTALAISAAGWTTAVLLVTRLLR